MFGKEEDLFYDWYQKGLPDDSNLKPINSKFYMERDSVGKPLCFFEVASDYEDEYLLTNLPKTAAIKHPCYLVLYTAREKKIESLRVKKLFPKEGPFKVMHPKSFLGMISAVKSLLLRIEGA